jgi:hypothetical protein
MSEHLMNQQLVILGRFADCFGRPVEGFAREALSERQVKSIRALAAGELDEVARAEMVSLLARNEAAMEMLAELAKDGSPENSR